MLGFFAPLLFLVAQTWASTTASAGRHPGDSIGPFAPPPSAPVSPACADGGGPDEEQPGHLEVGLIALTVALIVVACSGSLSTIPI